MSLTRTLTRRMHRQQGQRWQGWYWRFEAFKRKHPRLRYEWTGENQWRRVYKWWQP